MTSEFDGDHLDFEVQTDFFSEIGFFLFSDKRVGLLESVFKFCHLKHNFLVKL